MRLIYEGVSVKRVLYIALALVCLAPMGSQASHHRGHAVMFLDSAIADLQTSIAFAEIYRDQDAGNDQQIFHANKYVIYASKYLNRMISARDQLLSGGDLDVIRRLLNAPGLGTEKESVLWGFNTTEGIALNLITPDVTNHQRLRKIFSLHSKALGSLGWAKWHVIDAIREEIYGDQQFACNGVGC